MLAGVNINHISFRDFAECHMFPYSQLESLVMASKTSIVCPKSQATVMLDSIVPELTMADLSRLLMKFEDLEILEKIAEGGFGAVFKAKLKTASSSNPTSTSVSASSLVAVKQLIESSHEDASVCTLSHSPHPPLPLLFFPFPLTTGK